VFNPTTAKVKKMIAYAEKQKASIIESKINEVMDGGKTVKSVLMKEGLAETNLLTLRKKVATIPAANMKNFTPRAL
jgi:hypothetical protein